MSSRLYRALCGAGDAFVAKTFPKGPINTIWHHEAGPKTIFFWAPFWKWTIVIAGIADLARPAHRNVTIFFRIRNSIKECIGMRRTNSVLRNQDNVLGNLKKSFNK